MKMSTCSFYSWTISCLNHYSWVTLYISFGPHSISLSEDCFNYLLLCSKSLEIFATYNKPLLSFGFWGSGIWERLSCEALLSYLMKTCSSYGRGLKSSPGLTEPRSASKMAHSRGCWWEAVSPWLVAEDFSTTSPWALHSNWLTAEWMIQERALVTSTEAAVPFVSCKKLCFHLVQGTGGGSRVVESLPSGFGGDAQAESRTRGMQRDRS